MKTWVDRIPEAPAEIDPAVVSRTIRRLRRERGWTQEMLAEVCGISRQVLGRWECATWLPNATSLLRLSLALECSIETLIGRAS